MKQCKKCKEFKNESEFNKCKDIKDGLRGSCKICRKNSIPLHVCSKCNELKTIATWVEDKCYCHDCYDLLGLQPQYICFKCNELKIIQKWVEGKGYCQRCYDLLHLQPLHICSKCNELKIINKRVEDKCYCIDCYYDLGLQPLHICSKCNELKIIQKWIEGKGFCNDCYYDLGLKPLHICSKCNGLKEIQKWVEGKGYCDNCYFKKRYLEEPKVNIVRRLRGSVQHVFNYKGIKKIHRSKEYGIDFDKIRKHVGSPPNKTSHLDHIFPLTAFDYSDKFQIWASWHYTNFQWLTAEENQKKGAKYNKEEFEKYLDGLKEEWNGLKWV